MFRINVFDELNRIERELMGNNHCVAVMPRKNELEVLARLPVSSIYETENSVIAAFELPGIEKEDIELNIDSERIEVKVDKKTEEKSEQGNFRRMHSFYGSLPLPTEVMADSAEASLKNGILRIEIPKAKKQSMKKIEIK